MTSSHSVKRSCVSKDPINEVGTNTLKKEIVTQTIRKWKRLGFFRTKVKGSICTKDPLLLYKKIMFWKLFVGTMLTHKSYSRLKIITNDITPLVLFYFAGPFELTWSSIPSPSSTAVINTTLDERSSNAWEPKWFKKF